MKTNLLILLILTSFATGACALPDLAPTSLNVTAGNLIPWMDVTLTAEITNTGNLDAYDVGVRFNNENDAAGIADTSIPFIAAGTTEIVSVTWNTGGDPRDVNVKVIADYDNLIDESDEVNNELTQTFSIQDPDLTIYAFYWTPDPLVAGEPATLHATVENVGSTNETNTIYITLYLDGMPQQVLTLDQLNLNDPHQIEFNWTAVPGDHNIEIRIDDNNGTGLIPERNEDNNNVYADLPHIAAPDLIVEDFWVNSGDMSSGDDVILTTVLRNNGDADVTDKSLFITYYANGEPVGEQQYTGIYIAQGVSINLDMQWTVNAVGNINMTATVDSHSEITEINETNNNLTKDFGYIRAPDLIIGTRVNTT
jgi:subtilase family serine protease